MNYKLKKIYFKIPKFLLASLIIILLIIPSAKAEAASALVYFETEDDKVSAGDTISVYLCVDTDSVLGDFEGIVSYDSNKLDYVSGSNCISGGDGTLKVNDYGAYSDSVRKYVMNFEVTGTGVIKFKMSNSCEAYEYESGDAMSVSTEVFNIQSSAPAQASKNTSLSSLKISPGVLEPGFDPKILVYNTSIDANTLNLVVSANAEDLSAKVEIKGNQNLTAGENEIIVTVTAEAGNTADYLIKVMKGEKQPETEPEPDKEEENIPDTADKKEWRLEAEKDGNKINIYGQYYFTVAQPEEVSVPKGYVKTDFVLDGCIIEAFQEEGKTHSDYLLLILTNEAGNTGLYRYDRIEKTVQRYTGDKKATSGTADEEVYQLISLVNEYKTNLTKLSAIIAVLCVFAVILIVGVIWFYLKSKGYKGDDLD